MHRRRRGNQAASDSAPPWPVRYGGYLVRFGSLTLALLCALLAVRLVELSGVVLIAEIPADMTTVVGRALWSDLLFFLKLLVFLLPFFLLIRLIVRAPRADFYGYGILGSLVLAVYLALVNYFFVVRVPLGADLFGYSPANIFDIARDGYRFSFLSAVSLVIPFAVFWAALAYFDGREPVNARIVIVAVLAGFFLAVYGTSVLSPRTAFKTEFAHDLALNKAAFFVADSYAHFVPGERDATASRPVAVSFRYLDPVYPFLRTEDTPDVLGEYFNAGPSPAPPNIVILAVEGLGRAFSGPNAYLGSFTPFLDELAGKSLYWENFLASQGRTFASLPSILGSLPFGATGFNDLGTRMPEHLTLLSILKRSGYRTRFYCGNSLDFDNQRAFLERQRIDLMIGMDDYDASYYRLPGAYWGYADRELLQKALAMQRNDRRTPYVDYVQTVSMHSPYAVPGQQEYLRLFEQRMEQLGFTEAARKKYRQYKEIYSTILYTDASLRHYFEEQAKLPGYQNTIFIVTGDHRLPEIPMSTKIDRYHVPLIIYSPLLKRTARIKSVSSHLDVTPSLLAFLRHHYRIKTPDKVAWVGSGLDMEPSFRNVHRYPMKHTINSLVDYISGLYFLNDGVLYAVRANMDLEPVSDEEKMKQLQAEFELYKAMNSRFRNERKLIPGDVYAAYFPAR